MNSKRPKKRITFGMVLAILCIIGFVATQLGASGISMFFVTLIILVAYEIYKYHNRNHKEDKK